MPIWSDGGKPINHDPYFVGGFIFFVALMIFALAVAHVERNNPAITIKMVFEQVPALKYVLIGTVIVGIMFMITGYRINRGYKKSYDKRTGLDRDYALRKERWKRERQERRQEKRDERQAIRDRRKMRKASEARRK